jgi:hypothetical protein
MCHHLTEWGHAGVRSVRYTITVPYLFYFKQAYKQGETI